MVKKVLSAQGGSASGGKNPKMKAIKNVDLLEIQGDKFVEGLVYKDSTTCEQKELKVAGIFAEVGQITNTDFVKDLIPLDKFNRIKIDAKNQKAEVPGICINFYPVEFIQRNQVF